MSREIGALGRKGKPSLMIVTSTRTGPDPLRYLRQDSTIIPRFLISPAGRGRSSSARGGVVGIPAVMESHFRYEERKLLTLLDTLELRADTRAVLGPL